MAFGDVTIAASAPVADGAAGDVPVPAGALMSYQVAPNVSHWAVVMASSTATVFLTLGDGL